MLMMLPQIKQFHRREYIIGTKLEHLHEVNMFNLGVRLARHVKDTRAKAQEAQETLERIARELGHIGVKSLMVVLDQEWEEQQRVQTAHIPGKLAGFPS